MRDNMDLIQAPVRPGLGFCAYDFRLTGRYYGWTRTPKPRIPTLRCVKWRGTMKALSLSIILFGCIALAVACFIAFTGAHL